MNFKKLVLSFGIGLNLAVVSKITSAQVFQHYFFEDNDLEWILRDTGSGYQPITSGDLQVGDVLFAVFEIDALKINGVDSIPPGQELTGVAAVQINQIIPPSGGNIGDIGTQYIFQPFSGLNTILSNNGGAIIPVVPGTPTIAMWFNDLTQNFDPVGANLSEISCNSLATCIPQAATGTLFQVDGFGLDPDEYWVATQTRTGGSNIETVRELGSTVQVASFDFGLSTLFQIGNPPIGFAQIGTNNLCATPPNNYIADGCTNIVGSGDVKGGNGFQSSDIVARSDFQAEKYVVPEPSSLALFGIGLLGLSRRLRRSV